MKRIVADGTLTGAESERLRVFMESDRLPGRRIVGLMTAIQALQRPLLTNETRQQVAAKCKKFLHLRSMFDELPLNVKSCLVQKGGSQPAGA